MTARDPCVMSPTERIEEVAGVETVCPDVYLAHALLVDRRLDLFDDLRHGIIRHLIRNDRIDRQPDLPVPAS